MIHISAITAEPGDKKRKRIPKERKKRSWVWDHFEKDKTKKHDAGVCWVKCKEPGCTSGPLKCLKSNTTVMTHHLEKEHRIFNPTNKNDDGDMDVEENTNERIFTAEMQELIDKKLYIFHVLFATYTSLIH